MGWVAPLVPVADGAVDCGSVGGSTARWSHVASGLYRGVSSRGTLLWQPSCHGGMGSLLVVIADGAASTELSSLSCELFYLHMTCMCFYVMYVCVFVVCVRLAVNECLL